VKSPRENRDARAQRFGRPAENVRQLEEIVIDTHSLNAQHFTQMFAGASQSHCAGQILVERVGR